MMQPNAKLLKNWKAGILMYGNEYAIIAVGKRNGKSMQTKKSESLSTANTGGFLLPI